MKFKVEFKGFAYVEATNEDEALEKYGNNEEIYAECKVDGIYEVDEFNVIY